MKLLTMAALAALLSTGMAVAQETGPSTGEQAAPPIRPPIWPGLASANSTPTKRGQQFGGTRDLPLTNARMTRNIFLDWG